jgi:hypothetical protein
MKRMMILVVCIPLFVQCSKNDDDGPVSVSGSCTATVSVTAFEATQTFTNCMEFKNADAGVNPQAACTTDGGIFAKAGTWSAEPCATSATAHCTLDDGQKYQGVVSGYDADFNAYLKRSCDQNKGKFEETTAPKTYAATVQYGSAAHDADTCATVTGMSAPYRDAMKVSYQAKTDGTWTWTDDGACPAAGIMAKCNESSEFLQRVTHYYFEPNAAYKADCEQRGTFEHS